MFQSKSIAGLLSWHATNRSMDGKLRILANSKTWQHIEKRWPELRANPHNLRFGLGTDGVNPFGLQSTAWSAWPPNSFGQLQYSSMDGNEDRFCDASASDSGAT